MMRLLSIYLILPLALSCSAGSGKVTSSAVESRNAPGKAATPEPSLPTIPSYQGEEANPELNPIQVARNSGELPGISMEMDPAPVPMPMPMQEKIPESEMVNVPVNISGSHLYCSFDAKKENRVTALCQLRDDAKKKPIRVSDRYNEIVWSAIVPEKEVSFEVTNLVPNNGFWHAKYVFKGPGNYFDRIQKDLLFTFNAVEIATKANVKAEEKLASTTRSFFRLQSQQPHGAEALRCLDFYFDVDADHKGTTGPCTNSQGQRFHFNADNSMGVFIENENQCITYDPGNTVAQYVVPQPCGAAGLPRPIINWELVGQQLRIRGQTNCLSLTPDQPDPGNDYIGIQVCNANVNQRWEILPF